MHRRTLLTVIVTTAILGAGALARAQMADPSDTATLAKVESYLNGVRSLKARFLQVAPTGGTAQGTAWLDRPGRMRFQYDAPSPLLLVAGHGLVVFHDAELDQTSNIPIGQTPLGILLADSIRLTGGELKVTGLTRQPGVIEVTVTRISTPNDGSLTLGFVDQPLSLRYWIVTDAQRQRTRVTLSEVTTGGRFDGKLFEYVDPKALQPKSGG